MLEFILTHFAERFLPSKHRLFAFVKVVIKSWNILVFNTQTIKEPMRTTNQSSQYESNEANSNGFIIGYGLVQYVVMETKEKWETSKIFNKKKEKRRRTETV